MKKIMVLVSITLLCLIWSHYAFATTTNSWDNNYGFSRDNGFQHQGGNGNGWSDWNKYDHNGYNDGHRHFRHEEPHHGVVPEPISSALFLLGGAVLGTSIYRRKKR